ncbi:hypothetical protein [Rhizobium giardinii]|uniref:hypothetical protein n=1 Tax=Rhizobium giardinii TaxID=56731 RepID=UPI003D6E4F14
MRTSKEGSASQLRCCDFNASASSRRRRKFAPAKACPEREGNRLERNPIIAVSQSQQIADELGLDERAAAIQFVSITPPKRFSIDAEGDANLRLRNCLGGKEFDHPAARAGRVMSWSSIGAFLFLHRRTGKSHLVSGRFFRARKKFCD